MTSLVGLHALGSDGLVLVVDDDGAGRGVHNECGEDNKLARWHEDVCNGGALREVHLACSIHSLTRQLCCSLSSRPRGLAI